MIGILCTEGFERNYAEEFLLLFKQVGNKSDSEIIIFTVSNIDFSKKIVSGSLVSRKNITSEQVELPSIIFNLSLQKDMKGIKGRRQLEEMDEIIFINDSNKYDQCMLMDILKSSKKTERYLLPYHVYNKATRNFEADTEKAYIIMPSRGASISRVIHAIPKPDSDLVTGTQYFEKGHICDYIDASTCQKQWLFIEVPKLETYSNQPIIVRQYLQKSSCDTWTRLGRSIYPSVEAKGNRFAERVSDASYILINYINNFLPSICISFIDFILSTDGKPYFLHFSGVDQNIFDEKQGVNFYKRFYRNMQSLSADYIGRA
jgi:hypothetical protein